MGLQKHSDHTKLFVGHGFTGCGKTRFWCHSERSEESLFDLSPMHREILRFGQNDKRTFSAGSEAVPYKDSAVATQALKPVLPDKYALEFFFVVRCFLFRDLRRHANPARLQVLEDRLPVLQRDRAGRKNSGRVAREMLDEQGDHLSRRVRNGRERQSALADLVKRREESVVADFHRAILLCAAHDDGGGKPRVLQFSLAD